MWHYSTDLSWIFFLKKEKDIKLTIKSQIFVFQRREENKACLYNKYYKIYR